MIILHGHTNEVKNAREELICLIILVVLAMRLPYKQKWKMRGLIHVVRGKIATRKPFNPFFVNASIIILIRSTA